MTVGNRIKRRRLEIGLSVDQVAAKIGRNRATVYRYESNEIEKYPLDILDPLAEALQTTPAYLMGWEEVPQEQPSPSKTTLENPPKANIVKIAARDGSYMEKRLTDAQTAAVKALIDQLPDAEDL